MQSSVGSRTPEHRVGSSGAGASNISVSGSSSSSAATAVSSSGTSSGTGSGTGGSGSSGLSRSVKQRRSNQSALTESTVNFPAHDFDPDTVLPPEHASQVTRPFGLAQKRYATSVDDRHFLTVFEYSVNNHWIMWDYFSGYVHLTGLWKAIGNSKADIVKLVDNSPDLEPVIRRVRGGFLKIQGTWLPFPIARALAARTCYHIRFALVPIFGPDFPPLCLKPDEPGFGQLQLAHHSSTSDKRKRRRRLPASSAVPKTEDMVADPGERNSKAHKTAHDQAVSTVSSRTAVGTQSPTSNRTAATITNSTSTSSSKPNATTTTTIITSNTTTTSTPTCAASTSTTSSTTSSTAGAPFISSGSFSSAAMVSVTPDPPLKLDFLKTSTPSDLLDALHATRSLQLLAHAALDARCADDIRIRDFECAGLLWRWDGAQKLNLVSPHHHHHHSERVDRAEPGRNVMDINGLLS
ncbi:hypothetical protein V1511DRAFT_488466 [Dipodascopsis uninucleata]